MKFTAEDCYCSFTVQTISSEANRSMRANGCELSHVCEANEKLTTFCSIIFWEDHPNKRALTAPTTTQHSLAQQEELLGGATWPDPARLSEPGWSRGEHRTEWWAEQRASFVWECNGSHLDSSHGAAMWHRPPVSSMDHQEWQPIKYHLNSKLIQWFIDKLFKILP